MEKEDWLKNYKHVLTCTICEEDYGTDIKLDNRHCQNCIAKQKRLHWNGARKNPKTGDFEV